MAQPQHTHSLVRLEEAVTVLFCLIDDAYALLNPHARRYESIKRLSDSQIIALALFQQLRGVESERSFLRDAQRFFAHLFPGVVRGSAPFFLQPAREKALRRYLESLRREILPEFWWANRRPCSWTRRCWKSCIHAKKSGSRRAGGTLRREPHG